MRILIVPRVGSVPLQQLTRRTIKGMYQSLRHTGRARGRTRELSPKTVHKVDPALHQALEDAIDDGLLRNNPAARAHRIGPDDHEIISWSPADVRQFLVAIQGDPNATLWRLAAFTGMRRGELLGLKWSDIDFDTGSLSVRRQLIRDEGRLRFGPPKTRAGRRTICLDARTVAALELHRRGQASSVSTELDLVFCRADSSPHDPDVISHQFPRLLQRIGMRRIRLHDLRHTHASVALQTEVHPKVVQERLGHSSVKLTLDTYAHVLPPMHRAAAARFAAMVDG